MPFVYTTPVEFVIRTGSFWKRFQKWSVFKTIRFHWSCKRQNRIDLKTVWRKIEVTGSRRKYGKPRTDCSALLLQLSCILLSIKREAYRNNTQQTEMSWNVDFFVDTEETQVALTLYYVSDEGRLKKTASNAFGLSRACVSLIIRRITRAI